MFEFKKIYDGKIFAKINKKIRKMLLRERNLGEQYEHWQKLEDKKYIKEKKYYTVSQPDFHDCL